MGFNHIKIGMKRRAISIFRASEDDFWKNNEDIVVSEISLQSLSKLESDYSKKTKDGVNKISEPSTPSTNLSGVSSRARFQDYKKEIISQDMIQNGNSTSNTIQNIFPALNIDHIGLSGKWEERAGNYILKPADGKMPIGVIHFLGGAFVGAAPHLTYRYLLDALCEGGYVVVATPYRLEMDYVASCDKILSKFDLVAVELAAEYGPVPVIGLGHSCGALLQTLITCLFPDAPRAANILISYNNRPASSAIVGLEEFVVPISQQLMGSSENSKGFRSTISDVRKLLDNILKTYASFPLTPPFVQKEVLPLIDQAAEIIDQLPDLLQELASGKTEFIPSPADTREVCRRMYRARRTLLVQFENDSLDESVEIKKVLQEANTIMRMKRPMIEMQCELVTMTGTHITPLTQNILFDPPPALVALDLLRPVRGELRVNYLKTIDELKLEILKWLDNSINPPS